MSWTNELVKIYENNCGRTDLADPLLPLVHSTAKAQLEVTISESGDFVSASRIEDKTQAETIIPVTEDSGSRSAGVFPHPLADKLLYISGDYGCFVDGKNRDNTKFYTAYMEQLEKWCDSVYTHPSVNAIYVYLKKAQLIHDLVGRHILILDENSGRLSNDKICNIAQADCFVRFRVNRGQADESRTWMDNTLYDNWIAYYSSDSQEQQLCYATGEMTRCTYKHPVKIRNAGDRAKLFSANDESGFSYRGRFSQKEQAVSIGYLFSLKMHNALKWLIRRQGVLVGGSLMILTWESALQKIPQIEVDSNGLLDEINDLAGDDADAKEEEAGTVKQMPTPILDTLPAFRKQLKKVLFGYQEKFDIRSKVMVMLMDSATPGRLSLTMYSELQSSDFLQRLESWHADTAWNRFYYKTHETHLGSFCIRDIAECAYGTVQEQKLICKPDVLRDTYSRIIPCIIEGRSIPVDLVRVLAEKASNPQAYGEAHHWRRVLEVACGMIRKLTIEKKGVCEVGLDKECRERDYLYGRLLAVADAAESKCYWREDKKTKEEDEKTKEEGKKTKEEGKKTKEEGKKTKREDEKSSVRTTNARRFFETFSNRPYQTWEIIRKRLSPYLEKLPVADRLYYSMLIDEITDMFDRQEYICNSKLEPQYLHAYSCQLREIYNHNKDEKSEQNEQNEQEA